MALDFKKTFGFNKEKAREGMWVDISDGAKVKIAKLGTHEYQTALMRHTRKFQNLIRLNRLGAEAMGEITANTLADAILLDWSGIEEDGKPLAYSRDTAYRLLKESPDFRALIESFANDQDLFQDNIIDLDADSKNLPSTSSGT